MHRDIGGDKTLAVNAILAGLGLLSLIASFNLPWHLWGADYVFYFPLWIRVVLVVALAAFCIPWLYKRAGDQLSRLKTAIIGPPEIAVYVVTAGAVILLYILFSSQNHILGDGYVIQGTIAEGRAFSPTEPLDYFMHHLVFMLIGGGTKGAYYSYIITSYLSGTAFLLILFLFTRKRAGFIFSIAVAFCFAVMQFFFGYVENYTISFVLITLYLFSGWADLREKKVSPITVIALGLAIACHLNTAVFLPSLGFLFWAKSESRRTAVAWAAGLSFLVILGIVYIKSFTEINIYEIVVPPSPISQNPYSLLSTSHLSDLLNIWLLNFPLLLASPWLLVEMDRRRRLYFAATVLPALLFVVLIDPRLGAPRDWDMLSLPAAPIMIFIIEVFGLEKGRLRRAGFAVIIPLLLFSLLHTGGWIWGNTRKDESYARLKELVRIDPHYSSSYYKGYRNKSWAWIAKNRFDDIDETIRVDLIRLQGDPSDSLNIYNLASNYAYIRDSLKAAQLIRQYWHRFENSSLVMSYYADVLYSLKYYQDAAEILGKCIALGNNDYSLYLLLAQVMEATGKSDSAFVLYDKSFILRKDAPAKDELIFYAQAVMWGKYELAESGLRRTSARFPPEYASAAGLLTESLSSRNYKRADSLATFIFKTLRSAKKQPTMQK
jgi:hypothetical protein